MIGSIKNLYVSQDLTGEALLKPLKEYNKLTDSFSGAKHCVLQAIKLVAYPIFGTLALIGMLVKLTGVPGLKKNNEERKKELINREKAVNAEFVGMTHGTSEPERSVMGFVFTKQEMNKQINERVVTAIDKFTSQYRLITGIFTTFKNPERIDGGGTVTIELQYNKV